MGDGSWYEEGFNELNYKIYESRAAGSVDVSGLTETPKRLETWISPNLDGEVDSLAVYEVTGTAAGVLRQTRYYDKDNHGRLTKQRMKWYHLTSPRDVLSYAYDAAGNINYGVNYERAIGGYMDSVVNTRTYDTLGNLLVDQVVIDPVAGNPLTYKAEATYEGNHLASFKYPQFIRPSNTPPNSDTTQELRTYSYHSDTDLMKEMYSRNYKLAITEV